MDISFWTQFNPKIEIAHTTKKYFNQYLYKLVVYAPGGRTIESKDIANTIEHRKVWDKDMNHFGWWGRKTRDLEDADIAFLEHIRQLKQDQTINKRIRVEEPWIQIYTESEDDLVEIVDQEPGLFKKYAHGLAGPEDSYIAEILNSGAIIKKTDNGYRYKVILKDGFYSQEVRGQLYNYFNTADKETVKITGGLSRALQSPGGYMWSLYFYANDLAIITFLNLISPGLVTNIHELVVPPTK
jgi:hypothetical protein